MTYNLDRHTNSPPPIYLSAFQSKHQGVIAKFLIALVLALIYIAPLPVKAKNKTDAKAKSTTRETGLWISDSENGRIIFIKNLKGEGYKSFGFPGKGPGRLLNPGQVWVDRQNRVYVADTGNNRVVRFDKFDGTGWTERNGFSAPEGVAVKGDTVYVSDTGNNQIVVLEKLTGAVKAVYQRAEIKKPHFLWLNQEGDLFVACGDSPPGGWVVKIPAPDSPHKAVPVYRGENLSQLSFAPFQALTYHNTIFIVDTAFHRVLTMNNMRGLAVRESGGYGTRPGRFIRPTGLAVDPNGTLYVADSGNDRVVMLSKSGRKLKVFTGGNDPEKTLRNPRSVFVWCPVKPSPKGDSKHTKKHK